MLHYKICLVLILEIYVFGQVVDVRQLWKINIFHIIGVQNIYNNRVGDFVADFNNNDKNK